MKDIWLQLLGMIISHMSGPLRDLVIKTVQDWEIKAKDTADPWDDMFVALLKCLLLIP